MTCWAKTIIRIMAVIVVFCSPQVLYASDGKIRAFVSIPPQAYFVERIGRSCVDVHVLVGPGQSPATYEPTPKQVSHISQSQVYFRIGVPFENVFLPKISRTLKNLNIVDTRKGVQLRYFRSSKGSQVPDPHIWLDPKQVKIQARTICDALAGLAPEHADKFEKNLQAFQSDLDNLDARLAKTLAPLKGQKIYVFHPAFGYFARSYGLTQVAVEIEGKMPSPRQLSGLIKKAREDNVRVIFVQPQFAKKNAETIAREIGGIALPIDPLAGDYIKNLEYIADAIKRQGAEDVKTLEREGTKNAKTTRDLN